MNVSLIIPVYNEAANIRNCVDNLRTVRGTFEVIFVDGGSSDGTPERIPDDFIRLHSKKGRATQMNEGAKAAHGDILWFSHCDSRLPRDGVRQIVRAVEHGAQFGCFHIAFDGKGFLMWTNQILSNRRAGKGKIAFGDQGIFVTKELFERMGGFPELPIMEDYEFSLRMKRLGIPLVLLPGTIRTSARRYQKEPTLLVMAKMNYYRRLYRNGHNIYDIARRYRDIR